MLAIQQYLDELRTIIERLDLEAIERLVDVLVAVREREGRVFCLGIGGSASNAVHAVCDLRMLAGIEAYAPADNVTELTARINQHGWRWVLAHWLRDSRLDARDLVVVLSVDGGSPTQHVSASLTQALQYAQRVGASIAGVVGRDGGYTAEVADVCVLIPVVNPATVTPHTEELQCAIWHLLASHPRLQLTPTRWEAIGLHEPPRWYSADELRPARRAA